MERRTASRLAWSLWAAPVVLLPIAGLTTLSYRSFDASDKAAGIVFGLLIVGYATVGAVIASRNPTNWIGWAFSTAAVGLTIAVFFSTYANRSVLGSPLPGYEWAAWIQTLTFTPAMIQIPLLFLLFPDGHLPSRRWRPVLWLVLGGAFLAVVGFALKPGSVNGLDKGVVVDNPIGIWNAEALGLVIAVGAWMVLPAAFASLAALVLRFRRSRGDERQQIRWLAYVGLTAAVTFAGFVLSDPDQNWSALTVISSLGFFLSLAVGLPLACLVAVLKYRLWDLDIVVKKTLVFGLLALFITAVYVAVIGLVGAFVTGRASSTIAFAVGVAVALAFQPVRRIARRLADRVVYGRRATPYEVLSEFSERMSDAYSTEDVLPRMAQILASGTGASVANVWLRVAGEFRSAAVAPPDAETRAPIAAAGDALPAFPEGEHAFEVRHQGELLGALSVRMPAADPMNPAREKLVRDLAGQAGLVIRNVRLIQELRASRQRIVAAQDEERRKIERNIHDGAQQQLVALSIKLRLAEKLTPPDAANAREMLEQLQTDTADALENLRELARGIYPPLLADRGLAAALEAQARKAAVPTTVDANGIGRYPQEVESAVYFCALEAMQNIAKYANATKARIHVAQADGQLTFEVGDDGEGFDSSSARHGTGLQGMADRLDAIGGSLEVRSAPSEGTTVTGRLPANQTGPAA